ncbi:MAG: helix-turn-helix domain-containing protein [Bacillus sp. (in: firmicutes)]
MNEHIFVKFHKHALTSGLIGELGPERWQTLSALALYMNDRGKCFPSQDTIAEHLDIRRETVNRRIKALCDFRWQGQPILTKEQTKHPRNKTFLQNTYFISQASGFKFGKEENKAPSDTDDTDRVTYM